VTLLDLHLTFPKFLAGWLPALAVSAAVPEPRLADMFIVPIGGLPVPVVTCGLGALGILLSRPFARRSEAELGWPMKLLVSAIMLVTVELWIVESRPGWLFAFIVSIGLGFSGFSLLELFGEQVKNFLRQAFSQAGATIGITPPNPDRKDEEQ
jgi:hypothetical protein